MHSVSETRMQALLAPYLSDQCNFPPRRMEASLTQTPFGELYQKLALYLDLLMRWNARTNLTAIRDPEMIVQRHFGESLFAGRWLSSHLQDGDDLLDFGSGAGLPGVPIQLLCPELRITLSESQGKKAAFLRELNRALGLKMEIWAARVEKMPAYRQFEAVTLRAVDEAQLARAEARMRVRKGGWLMELRTSLPLSGLSEVPVPGLSAGVLRYEQAL